LCVPDGLRGRGGCGRPGACLSGLIRHWVMPPDAAVAIELVAINDEQFAERIPRAKAAYAEHLRGTGMPADRAAAKSEEDHARLLPDGRPRSGDQLLTVMVDGSPGGLVWLGPRDENPDAWWVWQIEVDEALRGRGVGRAAMVQVQEVARASGAQSLSLNVFGDNVAARRLYDSPGFRTTTLQVRLEL